MRQVTLITTGGTIEKTYDEQTGELSNRRSIVRRMLRRIRLEDTSLRVIELMSKDSLHMTDDDRESIIEALRAVDADRPQQAGSGIVILHGTDTLTITGARILAELTPLCVPVVLTGAMRPFEMVRSDALQNLTDAILATGTRGADRCAILWRHLDREPIIIARPCLSARLLEKLADEPHL